jgi:prophage regulatory protein
MSMEHPKNLRILRRRDVEKRVGLSRSSIYSRVQDGKFPRPVNLGARAVGWLESEIDNWLAEKVAARNYFEDAGQ